MINMKTQIKYSCLLMIVFITACSTYYRGDSIALYKGKSAEQIFTGGELALAKGQYNETIKSFEALDVLHPFSQYAKRSQFDILYAYYRNGDAASAVAAATRYIHLYPQDSQIDYVYYIRALANFNQYHGALVKLAHLDLAERDLSPLRKAYDDFATLISQFPQSRYAAGARRHMIFLRNLFAKHELEVAKFYYIRRAYTAAINRANIVLHDYPRAPAVIPALALMVRSYHAMKLNHLAEDTLHILQTNYPQSIELKELRREGLAK